MALVDIFVNYFVEWFKNCEEYRINKEKVKYKYFFIELFLYRIFNFRIYGVKLYFILLKFLI